MKKVLLFLVIIILGSLIIGAYFVFQKKFLKNEKEKTRDTFLMIHFEVGGADFPWYKEIAFDADVENLKYQEALWPSAVKMVEAANVKNFKLTLCFNPQWGEYILADNARIEITKQWQKQGHEIAFHHHGYDSPDWNGFSNRDDQKIKNSPKYRGKVAEGFSFIEKLAIPEKVVTGTVSDSQKDLPNDILINTYGGVREGTNRWDDSISSPEVITINGRKAIRIGHGFLESYYKNNQKTEALLREFKKEYEKIPAGKIFGVVLHAHDFYRYPEAYLEWLNYVELKEHKIQTVKEVVKE